MAGFLYVGSETMTCVYGNNNRTIPLRVLQA